MLAKQLTVPGSLGLSPRAAEVLRAARRLLHQDGPEALTMRGLAQRLDIAAPSLYKHFADKQALEVALIAWGFEEIAVLFAAAVARAEPLQSLARAYRDYATAEPHLYRLMTAQPLPRHRLPEGLEARAAPLVAAAGGDGTLARAIWAFAHGMVVLELAARFPPGADLGAAWRVGISAFEQQTHKKRSRS